MALPPIVHGDARSLPVHNNSVDLFLTSPPYFGLRDYGSDSEVGAEQTIEDYLASLGSVLDEMWRALKPDGSAFWVIGDKYSRAGGVDRKERGISAGDPGGREHARRPSRGIPGIPIGSLAALPHRFAIMAIERGWNLRQEIVWHKPNPMPESVTRRCVRAHEFIFHFAKSGQHSHAQSGGYGHDVWSIPVKGYRDPLGRKHPAVFPEALARRIIAGWGATGGLAVDPFAGSGTTVVVARRMGMRAGGVELNPAYVEIANDRVRAG